MCNSKLSIVGRLTSRLAAAAGLSAALVAGNASAQCDTGLGGSIGLNVPVGQAVHIGDTVTITAVTLFNGPTTCGFTNGSMWVILPTGATNLAAQNIFLPPGPALPGGQSSFIGCPGPTLGPGAIGTCVPFTTTYVVSFADIARNLTFATNLSGLAFTCNSAGQPKEVQFELAALGNAVGGAGNASACQTRPLPVIFPCICITKSCALPCFPYGSSITFTGLVSNCGDSTLNNIAVTDSVPATITFATTTTLGHPFNPAVSNLNNTLAAGDSVAYTGTYTPTGTGAALCGPFNDTIGATAQDTTGRFLSNTDPCINPNTGVSTGPRPPVTASCQVCTSPGIEVTKQCPTTNGIPGGQITFTGSVCNTGNVPLINVSVMNSLPLVGGGNLVVSIPTLAPGACQSFSGSETVPAGVCSLTDTLTAAGTNQCTGLGVVNTATATCPVACVPQIKVYKQVVCYAPAGCEAFNPDLTTQKFALGMSVGTNCASFCYRITVTNSGSLVLTNVTVVDNVLGPITCVPGILPVGASTNCVIANVAHCNNTTNIVTATGFGPPGSTPTPVTSTDTNGVVIAPINVGCALLVSIDGGPFNSYSTCPTVNLGHSYVVRTVITNSGSYPIDVTATSSTLCFTTTNFTALAVGGSVTIDCPYSCSALSSNIYCVNLSAVASQSPTHVCAYNTQGQLITATSECCTCVRCVGLPDICVTKEVVCDLPAGCSNNWSHFAAGAKSGSECPLFCYRIRVTNCGQEDLRNVTVVDNVLDLSSCNFTNYLTAGQTVECILEDVSHCTGVTNTVTATGVGALSGVQTNAMDTAAVAVLPISISCNATVNGKSTETILCDGQGHLITNAVEVCNTGSLPLSGITISAPDLVALGCSDPSSLQLSLLPGQCTNVELCVDLVTCPTSCGIGFSNHISITATVDQTLTNVCSWTLNPSNQVVAVTASTECSATVECIPPPHTGCTPGFWKNCTIHWQLTGYSTGQSVGSVFSLGSCCTSLAGVSLLDALSFQGGSGTCGGAQILLRTAVAGLLNASSPELDFNYAFTKQEVIAMVSAALQSCDRNTMVTLASELDRDNNMGCANNNGEGLPCHRLLDLTRAVPTRPAEAPPAAPTRP